MGSDLSEVTRCHQQALPRLSHGVSVVCRESSGLSREASCRTPRSRKAAGPPGSLTRRCPLLGPAPRGSLRPGTLGAAEWVFSVGLGGQAEWNHMGAVHSLRL